MSEAVNWSVMRWLREKKRVRKAADLANATLDQLSDDTRRRWPENVQTVYESLAARAGSEKAPGGNPRKAGAQANNSEVWTSVRKIKDAENEAYRARMDAEETFDDAERRLSTSLAREGCRKAIYSWELHELSIRKAEALAVPE